VIFENQTNTHRKSNDFSIENHQGFSSDFRYDIVEELSGQSMDFRQNIMKFQHKSERKLQKCWDVVWKCVKKAPKLVTKMFWINLSRWGRRGAKECKSCCRSRQELPNEYFLFTCKISFDTAEIEPFHFHNFSSLQGFNFHQAVVSSPILWETCSV